MGISGLLPLLKSIQVNTHIKQYAGTVVGVDAYVWLHRGAFACAWDLALGNHTTKYVDYAMHRIKMLRHYGVEPYVVFDGDYLPSKVHTETSRESKRQEYLSAGMRYHAQNQNSKAMEQFQKCIDITPEMAYRFILALRRENVAYVVAPYEADAQLAYLEKKGIIQAILTEDSDLLVFGCKTLLLKMGQFGDCVEIKRERFGKVTGQITFHGWTDDDFRHMAILSGCDYLASINGVGLITAHRLLRRFNKNVQRVVQALRLQVGTRVPPDYMQHFHRANLTFKHQRVFCPEKECMIMWNEPEQPLTDELLVYIGADLDVEIARGVARGDLHPMTKTSLESSLTDKENLPLANPSSYKPKPPTPAKTIKAYFSPKRTRSLQDITSEVKTAEINKLNRTSSVRDFFKPKEGRKRALTAGEADETISTKRMKRFFGSQDDIQTTASPFFSRKIESSDDDIQPMPWISEMAHTPDNFDEIQENEHIEQEALGVEKPFEQNSGEFQVGESPTPARTADPEHVNEDDVILDSPTAPRQIEDTSIVRTEEAAVAETDDEEISSPAPADIIQAHLPPSPLPSRPNTPTVIPLPSSDSQHSRIFYPGMKKAHIPRPSHNGFPDTPAASPVLSGTQSAVVQGWKERFLHIATPSRPSFAPRLSNTIASRPITPLHTPFFRRNEIRPKSSPAAQRK